MSQEQAQERIMDAMFFSHPKLDASWCDPFTSASIEKRIIFQSIGISDQEDVLDVAIRNAKAAFEALLNLKTGRGVGLVEEPKAVHPLDGMVKVGEDENGSLHSPRASFDPEHDCPTETPMCEQVMPAQKRAGASGRSPEMRTKHDENVTEEKADESERYEAESESAFSGQPSRRDVPLSRRSRPHLQRLSTDIKDLSQFQHLRKERITQEKTQEDNQAPTTIFKKMSTDTLCDSAVEMSSNNSLSRISTTISSSSSIIDVSIKRKNEVLDKAIRETQAAFEALLNYRVTMIRSSMLLVASESPECKTKDDMADGKTLFLNPCESEEQPSKISDLVNTVYSGYESDSAIFDQPSKLHLTRNKRRHREAKKATLTATSTNEASEEKDDLPYGPNVVVTSHDDEALAAFREHMAKMGKNQKHIPRPSVATIHSIMAETQSVVGTGIDAMTKKLRRGSMMVDFDAKDASVHDNFDEDSEVEFGAQPAKHEYGFMDFLQEPLDRKTEEREIQMVEQEILQSGKQCSFFIFVILFAILTILTHLSYLLSSL